MIVVALDSSSPTSRNDLSWGAWVGNGRNRWYDKHQRTYFKLAEESFLIHDMCL